MSESFMDREVAEYAKLASQMMCNHLFLKQFGQLVEGVPEMEDLIWLTTGIVGNDRYITVRLKEEYRASALVRALAKRLDCRFEKMPETDSLRATAYIQVGGVRTQLNVTGYLPEWCRLEETLEELPEEQWVKVRSTTRVVCGRKGESDDDPQIIE